MTNSTKLFKFHECGCKLIRDGNMYRIDEYCKTHYPNYQKKTDKLLRKKNRKRGKGYTKAKKK